MQKMRSTIIYLFKIEKEILRDHMSNYLMAIESIETFIPVLIDSLLTDIFLQII